MSDYLLGLDICSAGPADDIGKISDLPGASDPWGAPFVDDDPSIGVPAIVGHRGSGGRHHGGGRGPWGGMRSRPVWGAYPVYVQEERCDFIDDNGNCVDIVDILGEDGWVDIVGMFDFNVEQRRMDALRNVPVSVAQILLSGGMAAIQGAISAAKQPFYKPDLPGDNARKNVLGKLQWHANTLAPLAGTPNAMYASGDDLKKTVLAAFRESNAAQEGAAYLEAAWQLMWSQISVALANLPKDVAKKVGETFGDVVKNATGVPVWGWAIILTGVVAGLGFGIYKLANTRAATAAAGGYFR